MRILKNGLSQPGHFVHISAYSQTRSNLVGQFYCTLSIWGANDWLDALISPDITYLGIQYISEIQ